MSDIEARLGTALASRYRIERELGRGGMATVYLAHDLRHDRDVALKVLQPELSALLGPERFLQEIRLTAKLRHPHILPLFDSGEADGLLFYVMPLVVGESLRARLAREPRLSVEEAIRLTREAADALGHAHAQGIIHRDIKPENILLENGHAMVADFGIARAATAGEGPRITMAGLTLGTPDYMSPEQAAGDPNTDGRSDLYSLACVLFELLTGEPPFTGATAEAVLVQRFTGRAPRISVKRPDVPAAVDHAVARALQREPAERFESITGFAHALAQAGPETAGPAGPSIAVLPFATMSADPAGEYFGDGIAEEIINALTQLPGLKVAARTSAFSFKGKNEDLRTVGERLGVSNVLEGSVRRAGSRVRVTAQLIEVASGYHLWSERFDRELTDIFAIQDDIATGIATKLRVTLGGEPRPSQPAAAQLWGERFERLDQVVGQLVKPRTANVEAYELYLKGRAAMRHRGRELITAVTAFEQAIGLDHDFASAHAELAQALGLLSFWGAVPSEEIRERALTSAAKALAVDPNLPEAHTATALTAIMLEFDRAKASAAWDRALVLDPGNPDARIMRALFDLTYVRRDYDAAIREIAAAIERDPESAYAHTSHALALIFASRFEAALPSAQRAVELDPSSFYAHWNLLQAIGYLGRLDEALPMARDLMARFGRHTWLLAGISIAAQAAGRRDLAEAVYTELKGRAGIEYVQRGLLGPAALAAGHVEEGFAYLLEAARSREAFMAAVALGWPWPEPYRKDPKYAEVLREMGWDRA